MAAGIPILVSSTCLVILHVYFACAEPPPFIVTGRAIERAKELDEKCRKESGAGQESFLHFVRGEIEDDNTYKCFIKCIMYELAALTHHGQFVLEEELKNVPPEIQQEGHRIVEKCQHQTGADPCDTAFQIHKCYHDSNPDLYALVLDVWNYHARGI